ncbi:MAG: hypothetical protein WC637_02335 [Victivallales bacterium]|jgi:hypothetical protein
MRKIRNVLRAGINLALKTQDLTFSQDCKTCFYIILAKKPHFMMEKYTNDVILPVLFLKFGFMEVIQQPKQG